MLSKREEKQRKNTAITLSTREKVKMSGGHFEYEDQKIDYVLDQLKRDFNRAKNPKEDEWGYTFGFDEKKTFKAVQNMIKIGKIYEKMLHAYDWFISADTCEETFLKQYKKINKKMKKLFIPTAKPDVFIEGDIVHNTQLLNKQVENSGKENLHD